MTERPDITLILPAYNEAGRIAETISQTSQYFQDRALSYQILVSADGEDGTREIVRGLGATDRRIQVIGSPQRLGKGRGVREAVALAQGAVVGYADADNKVPISELDKILPHLKAGCPVVIGSRALGDSKVERKQPLYRQLGSRGFAVFMHAVVGLPGIKDTQCGFKFFEHGVAQLIFSHQQIDGYMFDVEILALAKQFGFPVLEIPIRWRDDGDSRLNIVAGNIRNVRDIFRIRFSLASRDRNAVFTKSQAAKGDPTV
jgi:dolichyl-phosphate beta-glucosyltransferase